MSRIGGAIRDTISIENDAPRVNVWERGRPSFLVLLNARAPNPGHSYLRLLRRKCLPPSALRVRLRTLNRTSYESRNAMTDEPASDGGGCLCYPKKTGQTPVRSLPRKENGKARTWMDEKSVRKSHGHHIPPAKGWVSERYSCSDSSACLRLRMRCATPMHSTAPPAIQVKVTPLRPVSGRPTCLVSPTVMLK